MSNGVRAWLLLIVTLALGIAIGVLGAGALQERRFARVSDMRRPGGFVEHVRSVIQPSSAEQWAAIKPIVEASAQANSARRRQHDSTMRASLDSLKAQLNPLLDPAQRERFARFAPDRGGRPPRGGPGRGAGPDRERGRPPIGGPPPDIEGPPPPRP